MPFEELLTELPAAFVNLSATRENPDGSLGYISPAWESSSGYRAEAFLASRPCRGLGVLVLAVGLPSMSGLELQRALTASALTMPIILLTASEDLQLRQEAMGAGALASLQKLVDEEVLLEAIKKTGDRNFELFTFLQIKAATAAAQPLKGGPLCA